MKDIHKDIRERLERGEPVYSSALGRVGEVMSVSRRKGDMYPVEICSKSRQHLPPITHNHTHGATTFESGDPVELVPFGDHWKVVNTFKPLS